MDGMQNVWYLGNLFLYQYYTVFDASPLTKGKDYITVSIAPINKNNLVGTEHYGPNSNDPETEDDSSTPSGTVPNNDQSNS